MSNNNFTVNQHFVPQVCLRGFSQNGKHIYQQRFERTYNNPNPVPIESVCCVKNLYELTIPAKSSIYPNYIENSFRLFENKFFITMIG